MSKVIPLTVEIPLDQYPQLRDAALRLGFPHLQAMLAHAVTMLAARHDPLEVKVLQLHALGYDDGKIAAELGNVRGRIAQIRRRLGLPPNRGERGKETR